MKSSFLSLVVFLFLLPLSQCLFAQKSESDSLSFKKNEIGWMFSDLIDGSLYFSYERYLKNKWTIGVNIGYKTPEGLINLSGIDTEKIQTSDVNYSGFKITPTVRYYINSVSDYKMDGFYVGAYAKLSGFQSNISMDYTDPNQNMYSLGFDASVNTYSLGLMIGYKLPINQRFGLDFLFIGLGKARYSFKLNSNSTIPDDFYTDLNAALNSITLLDLVNSQDFNINHIDNRSGFFGTAARYGITLTYAF